MPRVGAYSGNIGQDAFDKYLKIVVINSKGFIWGIFRSILLPMFTITFKVITFIILQIKQVRIGDGGSSSEGLRHNNWQSQSVSIPSDFYYSTLNQLISLHTNYLSNISTVLFCVLIASLVLVNSSLM